MKATQLTEPASAATHPLMDNVVASFQKRSRAAMLLMAAPVTLAPLLGGCITVNAPEDAIVIELNINIKQEVIYRLADDAGNTIDENADIF